MKTKQDKRREAIERLERSVTITEARAQAKRYQALTDEQLQTVIDNRKLEAQRLRETFHVK